MASPVLPPNPCLIGIVLVIKSHKGANTVFHYPPRPGEDTPPFDALDAKSNREYDADLPTTSSDDSDSNSSSSGTHRRTKNAPYTGRRVHNARKQELATDADVDEEGSASPDKEDALGQGDKQRLGGNGLLFGSMGLTQLLAPAPAKTFHKKKFEMTLDGLVYLGWPVFVREDGQWQKKKKKKARKQTIASEVSEETVGLRALRPGTEETKMMGTGSNDDEGGLTSGAEAGMEDQADDNGQGAVADPEATLSASDLNAREDKGETSTGSKKETTGTTAATTGLTMFNVVFLLNPPPLEHHLRVTEMYDHVVKKFSRALKWEQARSGYVWEQSQLILKLTRKAQKNKTPSSTLYSQILAASPLAKAISTLYATISTSRIGTISLRPTHPLSLQIPIPPHSHSPPPPPAHHALLLLTPLPTILASIAPSSPLAPSLTAYLHSTTPRKTFAQTALATHTPLGTILALATHLIHWRRARAIPPLHHRDTYIPAPTAPLHRLPAASAEYARRFSGALPPLPCLLAMMGAQPGPYARFVPSKDHKGAYFEVLAWLVRGGWVERVRTGLWVRVPGWVVAAREAEAAEADEAAKATKVEAGDTVLEAPISSSSSSSSSSSAHTAIPPPPPGSPPALPTLILHPLRPSAAASQQLTLISTHLLRTQGRESQEAWERCVKYFDGVHAVETIAVREGWKRGRVEAWVEGWKREGVLVGGRWF